MTTPNRREGFALALTLVFTLVLTGGVLTAMNHVSGERKIVDTDAVALDALMLAQTGLEQAMEEWSGQNEAPAHGTSQHFDLVDGYADVVVYQIRPEIGGEPALYAIHSRGVHTQGGWADAADAVRTVAQLATWTEGDMDVQAGWVSLTGLHKNGASGLISGEDGCGQEGAVAGVSVPQDGYDQNGGKWDDVLDGEPLVAYSGATPQEAAATVGIDWEGIVDGTALQPDHVVSPPGYTWPTGIGSDEWPIIYVDNPPGTSFELKNPGRGTLIVRGDLKVSGNEMWEGVVLVGGKLTLSGRTTIEGSAISGLNVKLGEGADASTDITEESEANGNITVQFNSCHVEAAMERFAGFQVYGNTWMDSWALY